MDPEVRTAAVLAAVGAVFPQSIATAYCAPGWWLESVLRTEAALAVTARIFGRGPNSTVLAAASEQIAGERVERDLVRGPAPAGLRVEDDVPARIEPETAEVLETDSILAIAKVAVPQMNDLTRNRPDAYLSLSEREGVVDAVARHRDDSGV